ncbi:MAG: NAD(P)-binding domain-containing protein, partial [Gemmatimonadales bacterium]
MTQSREAVLIVGAGPIGLACAIAARRRGISPLVIDQGAIAESIVRYPVGMTFFTTPDRLEIGDHPLVCAGQKATREEAMMYYRGVARTERLRVRPYVRFLGGRRVGDGIECRLEGALGSRREELVVADRLVLATGYFGQPNRLGVPGEDRPHVSHYSEEPHRLGGLDVVIVGAKNSAVELALGAFRAGARVTLVHRAPTMKPTVKYWLKPDFDNRVKAGEIAARWSTVVESIEADEVVIRGP